MGSDVNGVLLMSDVVLYGSSQDEETFPALLIRAMTFGIPIVVPDLPVINKYVSLNFILFSHTNKFKVKIKKLLSIFSVAKIWKMQVVDGVTGMTFSKHNPDDLLRIFSLLISSEGKLSKFAGAVGSAGKLLARNLLAFESITGHAKLLENVLNFPSDALLPAPISKIQEDTWEWNSFSEVMEQTSDDMINIDEEGNMIGGSSIIQTLEEDFISFIKLKNISLDNSDITESDLVSTEDLTGVEHIASFEEFERREMDQASS